MFSNFGGAQPPLTRASSFTSQLGGAQPPLARPSFSSQPQSVEPSSLIGLGQAGFGSIDATLQFLSPDEQIRIKNAISSAVETDADFGVQEINPLTVFAIHTQISNALSRRIVSLTSQLGGRAQENELLNEQIAEKATQIKAQQARIGQLTLKLATAEAEAKRNAQDAKNVQNFIDLKERNRALEGDVKGLKMQIALAASKVTRREAGFVGPEEMGQLLVPTDTFGFSLNPSYRGGFQTDPTTGQQFLPISEVAKICKPIVLRSQRTTAGGSSSASTKRKRQPK